MKLGQCRKTLRRRVYGQHNLLFTKSTTFGLSPESASTHEWNVSWLSCGLVGGGRLQYTSLAGRLCRRPKGGEMMRPPCVFATHIWRKVLVHQHALLLSRALSKCANGCRSFSATESPPWQVCRLAVRRLAPLSLPSWKTPAAHAGRPAPQR